MRTLDAVVVGGGPAGATAAYLLAQEGYEVGLLDREKFPRDKPCGEFINPAACDRIGDVFGITRDEMIAAGGTRVSHVRLQLPRRPSLDIPMIDEVGQGVNGVSLRRVAGDSMLVCKCRKLGIRIREQHNVRSVRRQDSGLIVSGEDGNGSLFDYRARIVLAADGTHSAIARQEGLTIAKPKLRSIGIVAHLRGIEPEKDLHPSVWMFPSSGDGLMFGLSRQCGDTAVLSGSVPLHFGRSLALNPELLIRKWIESHPELQSVVGGARIDNPIRTTTCFGHSLKRSFAPGILFLGDAARFSDPFTGEGIHHALESGILAARTAIRALDNGDTSVRVLSAYERDRFELSSRYSLCELVRAICLRPPLLNFVGERLRAHPALAKTLIGALVDVLPSRSVLSPRFVLRAISP